MSPTAIIEPTGARETREPTLGELLESEDPDLLREPLRAWIAAGRDRDVRAGIVFEAWLHCGGERELIEGALARWLARHSSCAKGG